VISEGGVWFYCGVCDGCKKHTGEKLKKSQGVMDHCFLHRITGGKPHRKKSKPAVFGTFERSKVHERYAV